MIYVQKVKDRLFFKNLTMAPIDKNLIDLSILTMSEKNWINQYHKTVFYNLKRFMNKTEIIELKKSCSAI